MRTCPCASPIRQRSAVIAKREFEEGKPPKSVSNFVDFSVRLVVALDGGLFVVGLITFVSVLPSTQNSLINVSLAVIYFALGL
jgi:hypothetical protein